MKLICHAIHILLLYSLLTFPLLLRAAPKIITEHNIPYYTSEQCAADEYMAERCKLDLQYPEATEGFATVVWFHGGGLTGGSRHLINLDNKNIAIAAVDYRLSPRAKLPAFIEDAAAATAWVVKNIARFGGDPAKVFVSGHSAGGYLTLMVGMDPRWLQAHGVDNKHLAGLAPISAQVTTHFNVKKLLGDQGAQYRPVINEYAPLHHATANLPPICLITGDRKIEWLCRVEENELLFASLKALGHKKIEFFEMGGLNHNTVGKGGLIILNDFISKFSDS